MRNLDRTNPKKTLTQVYALTLPTWVYATSKGSNPHSGRFPQMRIPAGRDNKPLVTFPNYKRIPKRNDVDRRP
jgi:hypothetical protein